MILDIADFVTRHCRLSENAAKSLQVSFVHCTQPTFLVFVPGQVYPLYVIVAGPHDSLVRTHGLLEKLYAEMPGTFARPHGVCRYVNDTWLMIQSGLPGIPWFRMGEQLPRKSDWLNLRRRAVRQLNAFHEVVSQNPDWVDESITFSNGLRTLADACQDTLRPLGAPACRLIENAVHTLEQLGPVRAVWQHGDFVLNNMLADGQQFGLIDLVDFGKSSVPLLDNFSLAISVHRLASAHVNWHDPLEDIAACVSESSVSSGYTPNQKLAFYVYYLLSAIHETLVHPRRIAVRAAYLEQLNQLTQDTSRFLTAFRQFAPTGVQHDIA